MEIYTPVKAMKMKCLDCCGWQRKEVELCPIRHCPLWAYRKGSRPSSEDIATVSGIPDPFEEQKRRIGIGRSSAFTDEQRAALVERLQNARNQHFVNSSDKDSED